MNLNPFKRWRPAPAVSASPSPTAVRPALAIVRTHIGTHVGPQLVHGLDQRPSAVPSEPQTADAAELTERPEANVDDFAAWFGEMSSRAPSRFPLDGIPATSLYERYLRFAEQHDLEPVSMVAFGRRIKAAGFRLVRPAGGDRHRVYRVSR